MPRAHTTAFASAASTVSAEHTRKHETTFFIVTSPLGTAKRYFSITVDASTADERTIESQTKTPARVCILTRAIIKGRNYMTGCKPPRLEIEADCSGPVNRGGERSRDSIKSPAALETTGAKLFHG